jgi:hypothetical protein
MFSKTPISLAVASLAIGFANFIPPAHDGEQTTLTYANYSACYEDPSGSECQKVQAGSQQSDRGAGMHNRRGGY